MHTVAYPGYMSVSWKQQDTPNSPNTTYSLQYGNMQSGINNVLELEYGQTDLNITTEFPGTFYKIVLREAVAGEDPKTVAVAYQRSCKCQFLVKYNGMGYSINVFVLHLLADSLFK